MTVHGENISWRGVPLYLSYIDPLQEQLFEGGPTQTSYYWNGEKHSSADSPETNVHGLTAEEADLTLNGLHEALLLKSESLK